MKLEQTGKICKSFEWKYIKNNIKYISYNFLEQFYVSCLSFMKGDETTTESKLINY